MTSLSSTCDKVSAITDEATLAEIAQIAEECETHLGHVGEILDAVATSLAKSAGAQRLLLWFLVDRLAKQHSIFREALLPKIIPFAKEYAPAKGSAQWDDFVALLKNSFSVLFSSSLVSLVLMQLDSSSGSAAAAAAAASTAANAARSQAALTLHTSALRSAGAFMTKTVAVERTAAQKHTLQVKTIDSQMAMNVASSYAPAKPVEILVPDMKPDANAPRGYMKALPSDYMRSYEETRRKRLRDIMEKNREEQDRRQAKELLQRVRQSNSDDGPAGDDGAGDADGGTSSPTKSTTRPQFRDFSDVQMPLELPRDEYGVKRGNFPLGVRFIRNAIASCGGAVELNVLVNRISTLASKEAVAEFGNVREFLLIHSPTFRLEVEQGKWVVRLTNQQGPDESTWASMQCPGCSKVVKGRNFARHYNSRQCITGQIALGLQGDYADRGPIAELAFVAKQVIAKRDTYDDGDLDALADCIAQAAEVRRFRLASPRQFAPVLKAMRVVRDRWLRSKGVDEMNDATVTAADAAVAHLFRVFGRSVHRLPIAWIEMGDVIDMCHRFTDNVLPPYNPPPRPADPRISLENDYPGFLLCESEVDDDDQPSGDEDEFSDDEAPAFTFAPPVDTAEALFTAGFDRDTKRLQHRMRTAPPMVLQRVLKGDRSQTQREMYADMQNSSANAVFGSGTGNIRTV